MEEIGGGKGKGKGKSARKSGGREGGRDGNGIDVSAVTRRGGESLLVAENTEGSIFRGKNEKTLSPLGERMDRGDRRGGGGQLSSTRSFLLFMKIVLSLLLSRGCKA